MSGSARDVSAWTSQRSFTCETVTRGFRYVWCTCPRLALGRVGVDAAHDREVVFALNREGRPIAVDILARTTPGGASVALVGAVMDELRRSLGDPHEAHGSSTPSRWTGRSAPRPSTTGTRTISSASPRPTFLAGGWWSANRTLWETGRNEQTDRTGAGAACARFGQT